MFHSTPQPHFWKGYKNVFGNVNFNGALANIGQIVARLKTTFVAFFIIGYRVSRCMQDLHRYSKAAAFGNAKT